MELIIAALSALCATIGLVYNGIQTAKKNRLNTLEFITKELNYLDSIGARKLLREMDKNDIMDFIKGDYAKEQMLKQYIYALNRICAALLNSTLSRKMIFSCWPKEWFEECYINLQPLIDNESRRRGKAMYVNIKKLIDKYNNNKLWALSN